MRRDELLDIRSRRASDSSAVAFAMNAVVLACVSRAAKAERQATARRPITVRAATNATVFRFIGSIRHPLHRCQGSVGFRLIDDVGKRGLLARRQ